MSPFGRRPGISHWGEERLIAGIRQWLGRASPPSPAGIGDDCAVLPLWPPARLLTVDPVVFGRHFDENVAPEAVGAKLLKRNLSDIAAMGGRPLSAVVSLLFSADLRTEWLERFHRGLGKMARHAKVTIVGGDVAQAPGTQTFSAHLTLLGSLPRGRALTRTGARIGDRIYVTGRLGGALASGHHHAFRPRLAEGEWLAGRAEVRAMMDLSDGLAKDLKALTPRGAAPAVFAEQVPVRAGFQLKAALSEGEDYELLFAVAGNSHRDAFEKEFRRAFRRTPLSCLGHFAPAGRLPPKVLPLSAYRGYEHFR